MSSLPDNQPAKAPAARSALTAARLAAVQAVYQMLERGQEAAPVIHEFVAHRLGAAIEGQQAVQPDGALFRKIVDGVGRRGEDLTGVVMAALGRGGEEGGKERSSLDPLLQAILLCGAYELLAHHETDVPVIISEYLNVTHAFYEQGEARLVNGVLDTAARALRG
jgi:N utilization substance protein B